MITSANGTQIDIIFTNFDNNICGTYVSYFSDHSPIFIMMNGKKTLPTKISEKLENIHEMCKKINTEMELNQQTHDFLDLRNNSSDEDNDEMEENISQESSDDIIYIDDDDEYDNILEPNSYLNDDAMDLFFRLMNGDRRYNYNMLTTAYAQRPQHYTVLAQEQNDVQILVEPPTTPAGIGHFICIFYNHYNNAIEVFDPIYSKRLIQLHIDIVHRRYPRNSRI